MPANIEIKARARDFADLRRRAEALSGGPARVIPQVDTFFNCSRGRLKLRELEPGHAQLVFYVRPDASGPKRSDYRIFETTHAEDLKSTLGMALGVRGVVRKTRQLYLVGQTRVHLDEVEGLGQFVELEVVMSEGQPEAEGRATAAALMQDLGINPADLLEVAYMDMIEARP
jgi:predicted adenylyl cyclase CyaB